MPTNALQIRSMKPRICWLHVYLLFVSATIASIRGTRVDEPFDESPRAPSLLFFDPDTNFCDSLHNPVRVTVRYSTSIVKNEYIVAFKGYYRPQTRENYIRAALNSSGIGKWKVVARDNPASGFPSDFDVVLLEETDKRSGLNALSEHPLVRRVTAQRLVRRSLKYKNVTEDEEDRAEFRNFGRKINSIVRIAFVVITMIIVVIRNS